MTGNNNILPKKSSLRLFPIMTRFFCVFGFSGKYMSWTRCLRPRGVGDADAQGAMRQLRGVGSRCRPKGRVAYAPRA